MCGGKHFTPSFLRSPAGMPYHIIVLLDSKAALPQRCQMLRQRTCLLVFGVVFLGACGGNGTSPEDGLTVEDAQFVAERIDLTTSGVLDDFFDNSGGDPTTAPALTHEPVV